MMSRHRSDSKYLANQEIISTLLKVRSEFDMRSQSAFVIFLDDSAHSDPVAMSILDHSRVSHPSSRVDSPCCPIPHTRCGLWSCLSSHLVLIGQIVVTCHVCNIQTPLFTLWIINLWRLFMVTYILLLERKIILVHRQLFPLVLANSVQILFAECKFLLALECGRTGQSSFNFPFPVQSKFTQPLIELLTFCSFTNVI